MAGSPTTQSESALTAAAPPDGICVRRWFGFYVLLMSVASVLLTMLIVREDWSWSQWKAIPVEVFRATGPAIKLLGFAMYLSLCCTFLPLPTGWLVAAVASREAAVAAGVSADPLWVALATAAMVGSAGSAGSTVANLNDYHLFTWMLRNHHIARVRQTRLYDASARWFARSPFLIVAVFNFVPIPVDVIRMLAATYRYGRVPFAGANFIGRFVRYGVIAFVTYWWDLGWIAVVALLALAVVLGAIRVLPAAARRLRRKRPIEASAGMSRQERLKEQRP